MLRFVVRRLLLLVPILLGLSILLFFWVRALPGDPAAALLGERATPEDIARINELYGFDRPLIEQYWSYLSNALRLDFGVSSRSGDTVIEEFLRRFPATAELGVTAIILATAIGIPLGILIGLSRTAYTSATSPPAGTGPGSTTSR